MVILHSQARILGHDWGMLILYYSDVCGLTICNIIGRYCGYIVILSRYFLYGNILSDISVLYPTNILFSRYVI